jgi:hypothetical protein
MFDIQELADRYVAVWNETDADKRRTAIERLWAPGGVHYVRTLEARGYAALETRITGSHEKNVRDGGYRFRPAGEAQSLRDVATLRWEMVPAAGGDVEATGLEFLVVDGDGRILSDYQFIES